MRTRVVRFTFSFLMVVSLIVGASVSATTMRIAYVAPDPTYTSLWAAKDFGFFKKNDLAAELISINSSSQALASLLGGEVDLSSAERPVGSLLISAESRIYSFSQVSLIGLFFYLFKTDVF